MTVSTTINAAVFYGSGTTGGSSAPFSCAFKIIADTDVVVQEVVTATGATTTLTLASDYTVAVGADSFTVTRVAGNLDAGYQWIVRRTIPLTQPTDLRNWGGYYGDTHEAMIDRLVLMMQDRWAAPEDRYTTATRPTASAVYAGRKIRVKDTAQAEQEQLCLEKADGTWEWTVVAVASA